MFGQPRFDSADKKFTLRAKCYVPARASENTGKKCHDISNETSGFADDINSKLPGKIQKRAIEIFSETPYQKIGLLLN